MGHEQPLPSMQFLNRRAERARRAQETIGKAIPDIMRASPRVRHGVRKADLIVDPEIPSHHGSTSIASLSDGPRIRVQCTDTLTTAARISERPFVRKRGAPLNSQPQQKPNVAILNMASPSRPGGGFLDGANSQEEFLCARTTLFNSLWDASYPLPEVGGIYSPDVLVFRDSTPEANDMEKRHRYFVDVISAAMLRFPDGRGRSEERLDHNCSCGLSYCDRDRDLVIRKMKAVLRMAQSKGTEKLVLGAWGCGAYGNPVKEIAKLWRKVLVGGPRQRKPVTEKWQGIKEIIFAIPDRAMAHQFELAFEGVLSYGTLSPGPDDAEAGARKTSKDFEMADLMRQVMEVELQIERTPGLRQKARLRDTLAVLNRDLARGEAAKILRDGDYVVEDQEDEEMVDDDFGITSFPASDGEDYCGVYTLDSNGVLSDSSDNCPAEPEYEFRPQPPGLDPQTSQDEDEEPEMYVRLRPSPRFDPQTGWFNGSIDELDCLLRGRVQRQPSHASPVLRPDSSGLMVDEWLLNESLDRAGKM